MIELFIFLIALLYHTFGVVLSGQQKKKEVIVMKRFFYDRGDIIRLKSVHSLDSQKFGKLIVAVFEEKGPKGNIEMNRIYSPQEWIQAERELMELHVPGVEVNLFQDEEK